jgi:tetratricopeptide (TPR) repeat protein
VQEGGELNLALRVMRLAAHYDVRTWSRPLGVQSNEPPRAVKAGILRLVRVLCRAGQMDEAEQLTTRALGLYSREGEREDLTFADMLVTAGDVARDRSQPAEAEARYRRALRIREATVGPDDVHTAEALGRVAQVMLDNATNISARLRTESTYLEGIEELEEAEQLLRRELLILMRVQAAGGGRALRLAMASSYNNLGRAMSYLLKFRESDAMYRKGLQIREDQLGPDHVLVGNSLRNLGASLHEASRGET